MCDEETLHPHLDVLIRPSPGPLRPEGLEPRRAATPSDEHRVLTEGHRRVLFRRVVPTRRPRTPAAPRDAARRTPRAHRRALQGVMMISLGLISLGLISLGSKRKSEA